MPRPARDAETGWTGRDGGTRPRRASNPARLAGTAARGRYPPGRLSARPVFRLLVGLAYPLLHFRG
jgi:hypothetical protein